MILGHHFFLKPEIQRFPSWPNYKTPCQPRDARHGTGCLCLRQLATDIEELPMSHNGSGLSTQSIDRKMWLKKLKQKTQQRPTTTTTTTTTRTRTRTTTTQPVTNILYKFVPLNYTVSKILSHPPYPPNLRKSADSLACCCWICTCKSIKTNHFQGRHVQGAIEPSTLRKSSQELGLMTIQYRWSNLL